MSGDEASRSLAVLRAPAPEHQAVLRRRAAALARIEAEGEGADTYLALRFGLGGQEYALEASCIVQVGVLRELAPLPGAVAPLFGITLWRGTVLTVLDLRAQLGAQTTGLTDLGRLVIVEGSQTTFALLADTIIDMIDVPRARLHPLPGGRPRGSLLSGMLDDGVLVIDAAALRHVMSTEQVAAHTSGRGG